MKVLGNKYHVLTDSFSKDQYCLFLDFAFENSSAWGISTMKFYHKKDLNESYFDFLKYMKQFRVETLSYDFPQHYTKGQNFIVYELNENTRRIIKSVPDIYDWIPPLLPEDLAFYHDEKWWFYAISHERESFVRPYSKIILDFFESNGFILSDCW